MALPFAKDSSFWAFSVKGFWVAAWFCLLVPDHEVDTFIAQ
jgi:hypothetical protein